jgi:Bacteriophage protein of unknown function (DUF646).
MAEDGSMQIEGLEELSRRMARLSVESRAVAMKALKSGAMDIIADAKENIRSNDSVATGMLRASGKVQAVDKDAINAGFFSEGTKGYAFWVEYGRKAGKFPPVDEIEQWLKKKTSVRGGMKSAFASASVFEGAKNINSYRKGLAFVIARSIARNGSKAHPFLGPAVEGRWSRLMAKVSAAINKTL